MLPVFISNKCYHINDKNLNKYCKNHIEYINNNLNLNDIKQTTHYSIYTNRNGGFYCILTNNKIRIFGVQKFINYGLFFDMIEYIENIDTIKQICIYVNKLLILYDNGKIKLLVLSWSKISDIDFKLKIKSEEIIDINSVKYIEECNKGIMLVKDNELIYLFFRNINPNIIDYDNIEKYKIKEYDNYKIIQLYTSESNIKTIYCGFDECTIHLENNSILSFGNNIYGQLGLSEYKTYYVPTKIDLTIKNNIKKICHFKTYTLILYENGDIYAYGCEIPWKSTKYNRYKPFKLLSLPNIYNIWNFDNSILTLNYFQSVKNNSK